MRTKHIGGAALLVAAALAPLGLGHAGPAAVRTALASTSQTYYLHGTATDDASRVAGSPTATFDGNAPTGTTDRTQTGPDRLNATGPADPDQPYWLGSAPAGPLHGVLHLDWYWSTVNAESAVIGDVVDVNVYSGVDVGANTGVLLGTAT